MDVLFIPAHPEAKSFNGSLVNPGEDPYWTGRGQNTHGSIMRRRNKSDRDRTSSDRYELLIGAHRPSMAQDTLKDGKIGNAMNDEIRDKTPPTFTVEVRSEDVRDPADAIEVNPMLTGMALAMRAGQQIAKEL